jgi:predicted nucleic acid-binding protein
MNESEETRLTSLSKARTLDEIADFWDTHSLADYWDQTREVEFEVRARRRRRVTLDPAVYAQIEAQARVRGLLPETLVNLWLAERLQRLQGMSSTKE